MWDPVDKKVFRSRGIIFMEDKNLADWKSEKNTMLIVGRDQAKIRMLKKALNRTFAMKDLGPAR